MFLLFISHPMGERSNALYFSLTEVEGVLSDCGFDSESCSKKLSSLQKEPGSSVSLESGSQSAMVTHWQDVNSSPEVDGRASINIIVQEVNGVLCAHLTREMQFATEIDCMELIDLWFPVNESDLFKSIEDVFVANRIAHNVTHIEELRKCGNSTDYRVEFNVGARGVAA
ncbi:hypothetical protein [Thiosulfatimonas sediminis]|nr:hypothetical protein [Thiosulfatimonas sediminis]